MGWSDDAREEPRRSGRRRTPSTPTSDAARQWAHEEITWGIWGDRPRRELDVLGDVAGLDVVELGCGTAYFSAWLARRGARPVGVDITPAQLETARRAACARQGSSSRSSRPMRARRGCPTRCADLVLSEYGASIWVDPYRWIPEAARLLRPRRAARVPPQLDACDALPPPTRAPAEEQLAPSAVRDAPLRVARRRRRVPPPARRVDRPAARERVRDRAADRDPGAGDAETHHHYYASSPPSGRSSGRPRRSGSRGSAMSAPPRRRSCSRRPRRSGRRFSPSSASRSRSSRPTTRRSRAPIRSSTPPGKARSVDGGDRPVLGVDTIVVCGGELIGKPRDARRRRAHARGAVGRDARGRVSGLCLRTPAVGGASPRDDARHVPRACRRATSRSTSRAASGRAGPARTPSRASARASSSASRATT